jgi:hypothetical protein
MLTHMIDEGFKFYDDCILMSTLFPKKLKFDASLYHDKTGFECFVNHIHINDYADEDYLEIGLAFLLSLGSKLQREFSKRKFRLILSENNDGCTVRFHCLRNGERWTSEDLDQYKEEGIFIIDF